MAFSSQLYPGEEIYDDDTPEERFQPPEGQGRGLRLEMRSTPFGEMPSAPPFPSELLIPRSEWQSRIQEMEERKTRTSDMIIRDGLPCKNQQQTSYCWINAPTHCVEILRAIQNEEMVILSPASCGAKIKNFKNQGGWGEEGLEYIVQHGVVPVSMWPANAIERQYDRPEAWEEAKKYRVTEWMELRPRNLDEQVSVLLRRIPAAVGQNHWGHEVTHCDAVWLDGEAAIRGRNSWGMEWPNPGAMGFFIQRGSKMLADDIVCPRVAMAA